MSHILASPGPFLSPPPVMMCLPSGLNAILVTWPEWPVSSCRGMPVRASHTFAVLSSLPVTIRVPSRLNTTHFTPLVWPFSSSSCVPVRASQTFAASSAPLTMRVPSGLNARQVTPLVYPFSSTRGLSPVCASHTFAVWS